MGCNAIGPNGEQFLLPPWFLPNQPHENGFPLFTDWCALAYVSAFSPDGRLLAWGTEEGEVMVADIAEVRRLFTRLKR